MKFLRTVLPAALLFGVTTLLAADPAADRAEAAAAFDSGDYARAVQLYSRTRETAAASGDDQTWSADTMALARAYMRSGDPKQAQRLLAELTGRFPGFPTGNLPGEILVAEGRVKEAKAFFRQLMAANAADPAIRGEAELALCYLQMISGDKKELAEALRTLERLEKDARFAAEARLRRIFALIRAGREKEALDLADKTRLDSAPQRRRLEMLRLLALLNTGASDEFYAGWEKSRKDILPRPDKLAFDTLTAAAEKAEKSPHPERAKRYWEDAYGFADRDEVRRYVLRRLFNCCARVDAKEAVAVADRYAKIFPVSGVSGEALTERAEILTEAGNLLNNAGRYKEALAFFKMVADDSKMLPDKRRTAVMGAAVAAEKSGDQPLTKYYYESLIGATQTPRQQQESQKLYAEYLIRSGDLPGAERLLRGISGVTDPKLKDVIGKLLFQVLKEQKKFEDALREADGLRHSHDRSNAEFGEFYAAVMTDKLGRSAEARERYRGYCKNYPKGNFIKEARFTAAKLAEETGDYAAAAKEFFAYGEDYSKDPAAGSALFWALRSACRTGDREGAVKAFAAIQRVTGVGPEYYAAALQLSDFMRRNAAAAEALRLLDRLDRSKCLPYQAALLNLMRAKLLVANGMRDEAIAAAEQLLNDYPNESAAADAAYLAGELYLKGEKPAKALEMMLRARQLRPAGNFDDAAAARAADCRLGIYKADNSKQDELQKAAEEFERLANSESTDPNIRLMCKHKLGICRAKQNDPSKAVRAYGQTLEFAIELKRLGRAFEPRWCLRSAYEALQILLTCGWPDADQRGAEIIEKVRQLELPGGDREFDVVLTEFKKRCLKR